MRYYRYGKPDKNQGSIVDELRFLGFHVIVLNSLVDIVVTGVDKRDNKPRSIPVEVKTPGGGLEKSQEKLREELEELDLLTNSTHLVAQTTEDILEVFGWGT